MNSSLGFFVKELERLRHVMKDAQIGHWEEGWMGGWVGWGGVVKEIRLQRAESGRLLWRQLA